MDTAIFNVSTKLLASLQSNEPLTTFFRIVRDDNAFTSSLEVAMGLQEMECPAELWDSDRGRVDEKYLSMTRNIRSYLYHYLYNFPAKLSSVADFLTVFAHLNPSMSPDVIAENLNDCNRVREALMEIIRFDAEGASSSRLMKLYEPKCRSRWTLQCAGATSTYDLEGSVKSGMGFSDGGDSMLSGHHELLLEYCTRSHATGDERDLKHALPELLDFQSNIVLSREGDVVGGSLHTIVDTFLHQLGWTRRLRDVISQLSDAGHFDFYPSYLIHLSVELEDSEFVCRVEEAQRTLSQWTACIADLRDKFHFLNYFDIKRCFVLLDSLVKYVNNGRTGGSAFAALRDVVSGYVCFINPEAGHDEAITTEATDRLLRGWLASGQATLQTAASSALLVPFCGALHEALCFVGPRWRAVHLADMDQYVNVPELKNGIVYSVCAPSTKEEYEQALTMYASRGVMPEWEVCMVCSKYTSLETVSNFLLRWRKSHLFGRENSLFYMVEIQDLSYEIQDDIGHLLREILSEKSNSSVGGRMFSRGPLVLSSRGSKHVCPLTAQFQHSLISNSSLPSNILSKLFSQLADTRQGNVGVEVHHGKQVGCGKSFNIRLKAVNDRYTYAYVPVNGSAYLPRERSVLLKRIVDCLQSSKSIADEKPLLHVDVANSVNPTLASFLFELCSLGVISDHFGECMVCLPPGSTVCVELAASLLHSTLAHCMVYPVKIATSSRANFHLCNATLRAGMGPDFDSPIFDGTIGTGRGTGMSSATSFERLKYVCVALNVLHYGRGTFPYAFDVMDVSGISKGQLQRLLDMKASVDAVEDSNKLILSQAKTLEDREKRGEAHERIAAAHDIERLLFTGHGLDGARAFDLLFSAIKHGNIRENDIVPTQGNTHVSLWCIWNFVNVLYWQLKEMHVLDSPLNGACMPDAHTGARTLEEDTRSKRKIKGEILQFVIRTAGEFATRQTEMKPVADRITGVRVSGMGRAVFNKHWNRMAYDNDGKPCFRSPCSTYFLYYRALANSWVIDDIIETSGATYAFSKNDDINSLWIASPEWSKTTAVTSAPGPHMTSAYRSETILITGCSRIGGNCSSTEDGVYLRQPPYDDINGHPHFIKMSDKLGEGVRRHFFYSRFRRWIIAPQCNEDDGYFIMSENGQYSNTWLFLPPDAPERKAQFQIIRQRGEDDVSDSKLPGIALANDSNMADDLEEFPLFDLELLRWQDSNHECILFNNDAHTVAFLCANPTLMSKSLHPTLLRHLEQNGIRIEGGSMAGDEVSLSYWTILSALTGIAKGDSLLKILAIVYSCAALYIQSMVAKQMSKCSNSDERNIISDLISRSQEYVRGFEGDPSVVSLRDVQRCIDLIRWFFLKVGVGKKGENKRSGRVVVSALGRSTILSIAIVYGYRLPSASSRNSFFLQISSIVKRWGKTATKVSFDELGRAGFAQTILDNMMRRFVNNLVVEESIALNQALTENLFVSIICILNKIPIFIVGKPGTSKTLAIQIIASNLQGKQSPMPLWRNFPAVYIFQYQCSPLSTSSSILYQFEAAKSYQEHAEDVLTVLLLDEVGLAENSPDMPLKVLHYMLVNPPVAIVGLSNWALDSSKMNRAVCLQRPEPSPEDIMFTGQNIVGSISEGASLESSSDLPPKPVLAREKSGATRLQPWLMNLAHAFHKIYSNQKQYFGAHSRDFIGMRDYYSLLKHLRQEFTARGSTSVTTAVLVNAVARNFGGKPHAIDAIVCLFCSLCFDTSAACCPATPSALPLIRENMVSTSSRHLMVLSTNDTALHLLFGSRVLNPKETTVLVGSRFKDDLQELHIVQQINQVAIFDDVDLFPLICCCKVKNAMARGHVVALMHNERYFDLYVSFLSYALFFSMFESLYDVLNQRYVRKTDIETGQEKLMLRLALGPRSQLCPVEKGFKLIVIVDQQQAYDSLDLPLLNRFEKQVLFPSDLLRSEMCGQALEKVQILCDKILLESGFSSLNEVFCGYYDKTVPSLVLNVTDFGRKRIYASDETLLGDSDGILLDDVIDRCVNTLVRVSFPTAMMRSSILRSFAACGDKGRSNKQYSFTQRHIFSALDEELNTDYSSSNKMLVVLTKSPISHFQLALESWRVACESTAIAEKYYIRSSHLKVIQLALISSERQLRADLNSFLSSYAADAPTSLVVLCDPLHCSPSLVSHARFVCTGAMQGHISRSGEESVRRHIVFVMHLPPGVRSRRREYILDFHPPWQYAFVDDVRADGDREGFSIGELVQKSSFDIYSKAPDALRHAMLDNFQSALSRCSSPFRNMLALNQAQRSYFKVTKDLLDDNLFLSFVQESVLLCLRHIGDGDSGDIPLHVTIACADYENIAGTFQECLIMALENLVIQALSHAIRNIDHDFNMGCIYSLMVNGGDESARTRYMQSWIALARKLCSPDAIARTSLVVSPASVDYKSDCVVRNSGLHGPLSCRFPFSEKIVAIIGHDHTRHQVETAVAGSISDNRAIGNNSAVLNTIRSTASFIGSVLGGETAGTPLGVFAAADAEAYLHDFVDIVIHPLPGLTHDFYCRLFKLIIQSDIADSINSSAWYLPSVVHATYWVHESDFFHIGSILSAVQSSVDVSFPSATYNDCRLGENLLTQLEMELQTGVAFSLEILTCQYICEFFLEGIFACIESDIVAKGHGRLPSTDVKKSTALLRLFRKILPHLRVLVTTCLQHMSGTLLVSTELLPQHLNVLKPFWRLLSSSIVLREMLRMVASEDTTWHSMSCARLSSSIVDNNSFHYSPISSESLQDILHRSDASGLPYCSLLRCYIMEFVRNECDFLNSVVGISITYPVDIITLVGKMLSPSVDYRYSADIHGFLLLRKEVVSFLVYVSSSKYEAGARQAASVVMGAMSADSNFATEAIVFYLGHLEDAYSSGALALCCDISLFCGFMSSTEESGALQLFQSSATGIVTQAVFARDRIRSLSASVAAYISHTTLRDCQFPLCSDQNVVSLMEVCEWAKIYFVKSLRDIGGNELVMEYLKRPRNHPALPCGTTLIDANKCKSLGTSVVDPFGLLHGKEAYALACNAYQATALRTSSHDTLDFFMQSMQQDSDVSRRCCLGLLVAATFAGHSRGDNTTTLQNWLSAEFPSGHAQGCRYGSYDSHGVAKRSIAWIQQLEDRDTKSKMELAFDQLVVHSAILAIRNPSSWMEMVVMNPSHLARAYVPGMPSSNLMGLVRAMGHVGWYKCKNGHPYTVGNCTFPMEESTCSAPGCNARIGGTNHTAVKGTTRLGSGDSAILCDPGYFSEDMMDELSYNGDISVMVVRLMLHSLMYLSSFDSRVERDLYAIVKSSNRTSATSTRDIIRQRMEFDFRTLKSVTMLPEVDLVMALHLTFQKWGDAVNGAAFRYSLSTPSDRDTFLSNFESQGVNPVFHDRLWRENIQRAKEACVGTSTTLLLSQSFGQNWATILERPERNGSSPLDRVMTGLWKIREPVTFDAFCRWFSLQPSNALKYPVLSAILQHEKTLPCIKYIGDILAWHSFLFSVLPSTTTREQAGTWSNIEIVRDIAPPDRLEEGLRVLRAFCAAFNQCFNLVGFLYECNPNPFLTEDGRVDLSGGKRGGDDVCMGDGTTVNFSLPTAFHGETEAAGLCTIRLLTTLQDAHNRIAISLKDISEEEVFDDMQADGEEKKEAMQRNHLASATSYLRPGVVPAMRGQQQEPTGQSAVEEHVEEDVKEDIPLRDIGTIPVTSHRTPASIISQRLLVYDRLTTLMPAVTSSALQYPEPGLGNIQGFDMGRIEFELRETLLAQCSPLALHVLQFQFAGEIRKSGGLRGLAAKTRQEPLPSTIINQIWDEVDTQARLIRLLAVLEECITFVVLAGGATVQTVDDGDILLENYVLDTLLMNPRKWEEIRCPTLAQHVKLCNLQSIYLNLEERGGEDPLSTVALAYRELLPGHLETALKQNSGIIDIFVFLPILREFCSEQLAQDTWPPEANLKEYMEYSSEVDLDLLDWFAAVPDELELRHAYWTYRILAK
ncbi:RNF213 [Symbiodinium microadriaticum]|nr:RNF213 [Symbiodinium microadriaticum]